MPNPKEEETSKKEKMVDLVVLNNTINCLIGLITITESLPLATLQKLVNPKDFTEIKQVLEILPEELKDKYRAMSGPIKQSIDMSVIEWENKRLLVV